MFEADQTSGQAIYRKLKGLNDKTYLSTEVECWVNMSDRLAKLETF